MRVIILIAANDKLYNTISHKTANSQRADNIGINEYGLLPAILDMWIIASNNNSTKVQRDTSAAYINDDILSSLSLSHLEL